MWNSLRENPTGFITAGAGLIAAFIAFISLVINRSLTIRHQRDTQFYEALKRFGDKDSPMLRSSAAGLLGQMGAQTSLVIRKKPYFKTATNQLLMGLVLEPDAAVLMSIANAIVDLGSLRRSWVAHRLYHVSRTIEFDFQQAIMEWALGNAITDVEGFSESNIAKVNDISRRASATVGDWLADLKSADESSRKELADVFLTRFRSVAARSELLASANAPSLNRNMVKASHRHELCGQLLAGVFSGDPGRLGVVLDLLLATYDLITPFRLAFLRFRFVLESIKVPKMFLFHWRLADADLSGSLLRNLSFYNATMQRANISGSRLRNVDLKSTDLTDASFRTARLIRVDFSLSDLIGADFSGCQILKKVNFGYATIDERTNFKDCNWWAADFYTVMFFKTEVPDVDWGLLSSIFKRYGSEEQLDRIRNAEDVHPSVQLFMKKSGLWRKKATNPIIEDHV